MPSRIIREGILGSDRVNRLSIEAELFYRRLMSVLDDFGRFDGRPALLRARCYPLRIDAVSEADILGYLAECEAADLIRMYGRNGVEHSFRIQVADLTAWAEKRGVGLYLEYLNFGQKTRAKGSRFPEPPTMEPDGCGDHVHHLPRTCPAHAGHLQGNSSADAMHPRTEAEAKAKADALSGGTEATPPPPMATGTHGGSQPRSGAPGRRFRGKQEPSPDSLDADYAALVPPVIESCGDLRVITDPVFLAIAVTRDREPQSWLGWVRMACQLRKRLGRQVADRLWFSTCESFWAEVNSGERPENCGAALTARLKTLGGSP